MTKRGRESDQGELNASLTLANCLMLLSRGGAEFAHPEASGGDLPCRIYQCKTCNRQFSSFQALGGHRASHKKPRLEDCSAPSRSSPAAAPKPKTHECSICGLVFSIGQALGGHMRRHRTASSDNQPPPPPQREQSLSPPLEKTSSRRLLWLDLNLTPIENEMEFRIDKVAAPAVVV